MKFRRKRIRDLDITKETVERVLSNPKAVEEEFFPHIAVAGITKDLSLCVVYKRISEDFRVITFFPAKKGRYERKILQGR